MAITIALAGNPNCGKTTLFNALTGANQYVGNWPGVTVEKKVDIRVTRMLLFRTFQVYIHFLHIHWRRLFRENI